MHADGDKTQGCAKTDIKSNDGSTALHTAAFFGRIDIAKALLGKRANVNIQNDRSDTPLDAVTGAWTKELEGVYQALGKGLKVELDLEEIKSARPRIAALLAQHGGKTGHAPVKATRFRGSYYMNGEIDVSTYGTPGGKPLTCGRWDFKPSWSKTGDMLLFFRRLKNDPVTVKWITAICIINVDGSGFHQLTDGTDYRYPHCEATPK